jgi:hypothetical protein
MIRHAMGAVLGLALAAWMVATPAWPADAPGPETNGVVVLETDFGLKDGAVSAMRGVAVSVDPTLRLEDLTHEIPTFDIWKAVTIGQQTPPVASVLITATCSIAKADVWDVTRVNVPFIGVLFAVLMAGDLSADRAARPGRAVLPLSRAVSSV